MFRSKAESRELGNWDTTRSAQQSSQSIVICAHVLDEFYGDASRVAWYKESATALLFDAPPWTHAPDARMFEKAPECDFLQCNDKLQRRKEFCFPRTTVATCDSATMWRHRTAEKHMILSLRQYLSGEKASADCGSHWFSETVVGPRQPCFECARQDQHTAGEKKEIKAGDDEVKVDVLLLLKDKYVWLLNKKGECCSVIGLPCVSLQAWRGALRRHFVVKNHKPQTYKPLVVTCSFEKHWSQFLKTEPGFFMRRVQVLQGCSQQPALLRRPHSFLATATDIPYLYSLSYNIKTKSIIYIHII